MKISMWMLFDAVSEKVIEHNLNETARLRNIEGALPYLPGELTSVNHVYIACAKDLTNIYLPENICLAVCGEGDFKLSADCRYIRLSPDVSTVRAFALILSALEMYNKWYDKLRSELIGIPDLTRICEIGNELLTNYIVLFDPDLTLLAYAALPPWMFNLILEKKRGPYYALTEAAYKAMITNPKHNDVTSAEKAAYSIDPTLGLRVLYANVGPRRFDCRLCIGENERLFRESDAQLCEILAEVLLIALANNYMSSTDSKTHFRNLLRGVFLNHSVDERQFNRSLSLWQWNKNDRYICLCIEKQRPDNPFLSSDRYICSRLEELLEDACAFVAEGKIACVAHLLPEELPEKAVDKLDVFLKGSSFIAGVSAEFNNFADFKRYFTEAAAAVEFGRTYQPDEWRHVFEDYSFRHFFRYGVSVLPAIHYCDAGVRKLLEFRGAKVDYYQTLRAYLENDRNLLSTAKALSIHRTTLFYRLNRITELTGCDLENAALRLRMLFSIEIMEMDNE